jgi:hypothetical protein
MQALRVLPPADTLFPRMPPEPTRIEASDRPAVESALGRIEASAAFGPGRQARQLLRYLVEAALNGESDRLKGYTIGVEVLGRPTDFDPSNDTSVRVAMRRLRRLLGEYYAAEGAQEKLRLHLVPGGYVVRLVRPQAEAPQPDPAPETQAATPQRGRGRRGLALVSVALLGMALAAGLWFRPNGSGGAGLAGALVFRGADGANVSLQEPDPQALQPRPDRQPVLRFETFRPEPAADPEVARRLTRELRVAVARFSEIVVLDDSAPRGAETLRMSGALRADGRFSVELRDAMTGQVVGVFAGEPGRSGAAGEAVRFIATAIAQPYGLVLTLARRDMPADPESPGFSCVLRLLDYWRHYDTTRLPAIARCLDATPAEGPATGPVLAARALVALERFRLGSGRDAEALEAAYLHARRAAEGAPFDPRVQQALGAVLTARGDGLLGVGALRNARRLNPYDPDIAADLASRLIGIGEISEARRLLLEACFYVAARPAWMDFYLFLAELLEGDGAAAVDRVGRMLDDGFVLNLVARVIAARLTGDAAGLTTTQARLFARDDRWQTEPATLLRQRLPSAEIADRVAALLAGDTLPASVTIEALSVQRGSCLGDRAN